MARYNQRYKALFILLLILIPLMTYLTVYYFVGHNLDVYEKEFDKNNVEVENRIEYAQRVIEYNKGKTDTLDLPMNEDERQHMEDVKRLMQGIDIFYWISLIVMILSVGLFFTNLKLFGKLLFLSGLITTVFPLLAYVVPFDIVFHYFHAIFFEPGTWVFSSTDFLPNLFPAGFFYNMAFRIFGISALAGIVYMITGWLLQKDPVG